MKNLTAPARAAFKAALAITVLALGAGQAAQAGTNVSVGISQPGLYGRIDIGNAPPPVLVYPEPVVIAPTPVAVYQRPIYMYVPPVQQRDWRHYCGRYSACGQPVYFVREEWVRERYHPEHHDHGRHRGWRDGDDRDDHDHDQGDHGRGHGRGHGHRGD